MDLLATPGGLLSGSVQSSGHFLETACLFTCFAFMKLPSVFFLLLLPAKLFSSCCYSPSFISSSLMFLHIFIFTAAVMKLKQLFRCWNTECFYLLCFYAETLSICFFYWWATEEVSLGPLHFSEFPPTCQRYVYIWQPMGHVHLPVIIRFSSSVFLQHTPESFKAFYVSISRTPWTKCTHTATSDFIIHHFY